MAPSSSPLPAVGARVHSSSPGNKLSDTESDGEDMVTPTRKKKDKDKGKGKVLGTPTVPLRYPNLETPTQVSSRSVCRTSGSVVIDTGCSILRFVGL
jgi:hypothetical protein